MIRTLLALWFGMSQRRLVCGSLSPRWKRGPRLELEPLELRALLTATTTGTALDISNDTSITLRLDPNDSANLQVFENQGLVTDASATPDFDIQIASLQKISATTSGADAKLYIDFSNGNPIPAQGLAYAGGGGSNATLYLLGTLPSGSFASEIHSPTSASSGTINLDGSTITYSGLSPIVDTVPSINLTIDDSKTNDTINFINDPNSPQNGFQTSQVNGGGFEKVSFANKTNVTVNDLGGNCTFNVNNPAAAAGLTTVNLIGLSVVGDTFNVSSLFTAGITLHITGFASNNKLTAPNQANAFNITGANAGSLDGASAVTFTNVQNLIGGTSNDTFNFSTGATVNTIDGNSGSDTIVNAPNQPNFDYITGLDSGNILSTANAFSRVENLSGSTSTGNQSIDIFTFTNSGGLTGKLTGGTGNEWLSYASVSTPVKVNLAKGLASLIAAGISHPASVPMNVIGSAFGGDTITGDAAGGVLLGHNKGNTITAGNGRSVIIGGFGKNYLTGGTADDLIIGGRTNYDADILSLSNILAEWQSAKSFDIRVGDLRTGRGLAVGVSLVVNKTVFVSATPPGPQFGRGGCPNQTTLVGNLGRNWFFTYCAITIVDLKKTDQVN